MVELKVLVVDDEIDLAKMVAKTIGRFGYLADVCHSVVQAKAKLGTGGFNFVLTDLNLGNDSAKNFQPGDDSGIGLISHVVTEYPHIPIAMMTAYGSEDVSAEAFRLGAFDFISKPLDSNVLEILLKQVLQKLQERNNAKEGGSGAGADDKILERLIGQSKPILDLKTVLKKVSKGQAPVFIHGESGVGKEVVAGLIHALSDRADKPFVVINCGAIPSELLESELFGYKKGSFTGATADSVGLIKKAHMGTLFLDEIAELPIAMQVKLLRVIQEKKIRPLGATQEELVDFRVVSATHQNLEQMIREGRFRQDLFFRLHVMDIVVPPLRERGGDVLLLAEHFCTKIAKEWGVGEKQFSPEVRNWLLTHDFSGNVRELQNLIQRAITLSEGELLQMQDITKGGVMPDQVRQLQPEIEPVAVQAVLDNPLSVDPYIPKEEGLEPYIESIERRILEKVMADSFNNQMVAAKTLKLSARSLRYRLKKFGID